MHGLVTVFGGSGFVGKDIVRALARRGFRVRVAVRNTGRGYKLRMLGDVGQVEIVQANIRDEASCARALEDAEACVNAVGILYESGRQGFESLHAEGAGRLATIAARAGATRFVQISAIGADAASESIYARTKAGGRTGDGGSLRRRDGAAAVDRVRAGRLLLQPLRRHGADRAGPAADRRRRNSLPAGVRG